MSRVAWVAGGAGFIGSHLCEALARLGWVVFSVDNYSSGSEENLPDCFHNLTSTECDITDDCAVNRLGRNQKPDIIFHLASPASPIDYGNHPIETILANTVGTHNLLRAARGCRFVYASSSEVYGDSAPPHCEMHAPLLHSFGDRTPYAYSKVLGEHIVHEHPNTSIARIFNTYGPHMASRDGRCVPEFIRSALLGEPIVIHGDGEQTRSFCYVDDTVRMLLALATAERTHTLNIGNPDEWSVGNLASLTLSLTQSESVVRKFQGERLHDPRRRKPDISRYLELFPPPSFTALGDGLAKTIDWFKRTYPQEFSR